MNDPWLGICRSIVPNYDQLAVIMESVPNIKVKLSQNRRGSWQITFYEHFPQEDLFYRNEICLDDRIEWAIKYLENWNAWRSSYDTWIFSNKDEADKFITLYTLQWL